MTFEGMTEFVFNVNLETQNLFFYMGLFIFIGMGKWRRKSRRHLIKHFTIG